MRVSSDTVVAPARPKGQSVLRSADGGMLLWGSFAAIFLSGAVFYVHGIAAAIAHREAMQDAADAAAMASAVMHARGMNLIALVNMLMAALLAILVAIKLAESLAILGIAVATAMSVLSPAALAVVPPLNAIRTTAQTAYRVNRPLVQTGLGALHAVARTVGRSVPAASELRALDAALHFSPPVDAGFVVPPRLSLPTRDGRYPDLCGKAGELALDVALLPFGGLGFVGDALGDAARQLTQGGAGWFCGSKAGAKAPRAKQEISQALPELPEVEACRGADPDEATALCAAAQAVQAAAQPDAKTGQCLRECGPAGPYATRVALARRACDPAERRGLRDFVWQERTVEHVYVRRGRAWRRQQTRVTDGPRLQRGRDAPCEAGYGARPGAADAPVCDDTEPPQRGAPEGAVESRRGRQVTQILGCTAKQSVSVSVQPDDGGRQTRNTHVPQEMVSGIVQGSETFQLRAVALGAPGEDLPAGMMAIGGPGVKDAVASDPGAHLAVAQAEYYFHDDSGRPDPAVMLWQTRWRARLRRVRLPSRAGASPGGKPRRGKGPPKRARAASAPGLGSACRSASAGAGRCQMLDTLMGAASGVFSH